MTRLVLFVSVVLLVSSTAGADDGLPARAAEAFEAARQQTLKEPLYARLDAVWHIDVLLQIRPDEQLEWWANVRRPRQAPNKMYRLVEPSAPPFLLPESPGIGLVRWMNYMQAPFGAPENLALEYISAYLNPPLGRRETEYVLCHQLAVLEWAKQMKLPLPQDLLDKKETFLEQISAEQAADDSFSDLFAERIFFLVAYGNPTDAELERSVRIIVDAQTSPGVWAPPPATLTYDGESRETEVEPEHTRKMAMVALAEYLRRQEKDPEKTALAPPTGLGAGADTAADADTDTAEGAGDDIAEDAGDGAGWIVVAGVGLLLALFFLVRRFR